MAKYPKERRYGAALLIGLSFFILSNWTFPSQPSAKQALDVTSLEEAFIDVASKVKPSVVSIFSERSVSFSPWEGLGEDFFKGFPSGNSSGDLDGPEGSTNKSRGGTPFDQPQRG